MYLILRLYSFLEFSRQYNILTMELVFKKTFYSILIQIYVLSMILVIISWISFWLDAKATATRASLGITMLLSLVNQLTEMNENRPFVSPITVGEVWIGTCMIFVIGSLFELALVSYFISGASNIEEIRKELIIESTVLQNDVKSFKKNSNLTNIDKKSNSTVSHTKIGFKSLTMLLSKMFSRYSIIVIIEQGKEIILNNIVIRT